MRSQGMGSLERELGAPAGSLREVRDELLGDGRGAIVILPGPRESHLFVLDRKGLVHDVLADEIELRKRMGRYVAHLARRRRVRDAELSEYRATERALAGELARAVLTDRAARRVESWTGLTVVGARPAR